MNRCLTSFTVVLCVLFSSCVESEHPASDATKGGQDRGLYGTWIATKDGATHVLTFGPYDVANEDWHTVVWTQREKDKVESFTMHGFVSEIDGKRYFNLADLGDPPIEPKGKTLASLAKGYTIFHYRCKDDRAQMQWHAGRVLKEAVKQGVVTADGDRLTSDSAGVAKYLAEYGAKAFEKTALEFKRVDP